MSQKNLNNLYKDLQSDMEKDKIYWVRNDAKIRAVTTSKTYDEFRDIVAAAHLRSLSRQDYKSVSQTSWNRVHTPSKKNN